MARFYVPDYDTTEVRCKTDTVDFPLGVMDTTAAARALARDLNAVLDKHEEAQHE
jgi:hypothetical protein